MTRILLCLTLKQGRGVYLRPAYSRLWLSGTACMIRILLCLTLIQSDIINHIGSHYSLFISYTMYFNHIHPHCSQYYCGRSENTSWGKRAWQVNEIRTRRLSVKSSETNSLGCELFPSRQSKSKPTTTKVMDSAPTLCGFI